MRLLPRSVRAIARSILEKCLFLLSLFIPTEGNLVVFSMSRGRYWDNSRALFEYLAEKESNQFNVIWLTDSSLPASEIPDKIKEKFVPRHSIKGWYICSKAKVAIISYSFFDFNLLREIAKRKKVIMLWHAITTKYCGLLDEKFNTKMKKKYTSGETKYYNNIICSSDIDRYYSASYTGVNINKIATTGLPRNDRLFSKSISKQLKNDSFLILYAPTFRDYPVDGGSVFFPFKQADEAIAAWANAAGMQFYLRPHPSDFESTTHVQRLNKKFPKIFHDAGVHSIPDVMDLISLCRGLITDYSSIYIDALVLDLPVVFVNYDQRKYMQKRGLAYDYDLITPGPKVKDWADFCQACTEMTTGAQTWSIQREFVRKLFFKYRDSNACYRVARVIESLIKN